MYSGLDIQGSRILALAPGQTILRNTSLGIPSSSVLEMLKKKKKPMPLASRSQTKLPYAWKFRRVHCRRCQKTVALSLQATDQASICPRTPLSSVLEMSEGRALSLQATDQVSTCLKTLSSFPAIVSPLILGFGPADRGSASPEIPNPVAIWPGLYIWRFPENMMPTGGLCKYFISINLGGHSKTFIEVLLLYLRFSSLSISLQVIIKPNQLPRARS